MRTFSVGDKVKVNQAEFSCNENIANGMIGTICCSDNEDWQGVVFEKNISGHACNGACEYGHGWYIEKEFLELVEMEADENDLALFINYICDR